MNIFFWFLSIFLSNFLFGENIVDFNGIFSLSGSSYSPGYVESSSIRSIKKISENKLLIYYLKKIERDNVILDKEKIKKEANENKGVVKLDKNFETQFLNYIAITDKNGKILLENEVDYGGSYLKRDVNPSVLVMDETDKCPYAFIDTNKKEIICYDLSLRKIKNYKISIDEINDYYLTFDGKNHIINFFGKMYNESVDIKNDNDYYFEKPRGFGKIGKRFIIEKEKEEDLTFTLNDLYNEISRIARDEEGKKVRIDKRFIDIKVIDDFEENMSFNILVMASEVKDPKFRYQYTGKIYFFIFELQNYGLGKATQLPFYIFQEQRKQEKVDKEKGIIYLPERVENIVKQSKFFSIGNKDLLIYLRPNVSFPNKEGDYNIDEGFDILQYLIYFSSFKDIPKIYDLYEEIVPSLKEQAEERENLIILPTFGVLERISKDEILFRSGCMDPKDKENKWDCIVKATFNR